MRRRAAVVATMVAAAAFPAAASADVFVEVPATFLGGPIWRPISIAPTAPATGLPSLAPPAGAGACAAGSECLISGPGAQAEAGTPIEPPTDEIDPPQAAGTDGTLMSLSSGSRPAVPAMPPSESDLAPAFGTLLSPRAADWLAWQRPVLAWQKAAGASYYNIQIFRGRRRVMNAWSTQTRVRVPDGVLRQGRSYVWVVWPGMGPRSDAKYGAVIGRSSFAITLRPRLVFRSSGDGVVAELRPHIPFATVRVYHPSSSAKAAQRIVVVDARGLVRLRVNRRAAERLGALLVDRGPAPPVGLRGPGR